MAGVSHDRDTPWIAFAAGAVAALALMLGYLAWRGGETGLDALKEVRVLPNLGELGPPMLPDAPRLPDPPLPAPR